ncbi:energy-coupled thiamine transporter ThiT [Acholeplasma granularum]|uniref:energy-coupled thiamine transporter ThiT n=1 Tax=Acholeplasma granularum TaxID=264635 RepID=UPI00046ED797|nr:energy-coupled thiamine transporter ThiT [Acholeplasma granularum]
MEQNRIMIRNIVVVSTLLAIAIAIDIVTGMIPGLNLSMPLGGRLFNLSLLPIILIGIFLGPGYGIVGAVTYGLFGFFYDGYALSYFAQNISEAALVFFLDYIIAFGALGLSGFFKNSLKSIWSFSLTTTIVLVIRWFSSTVVGAILWASYATSNEWTANLMNNVGKNAFIYSGIYNILYTLTTLVSMIVIVAFSINQFRELKLQLEK